jgi:hypothetical protein
VSITNTPYLFRKCLHRNIICIHGEKMTRTSLKNRKNTGGMASVRSKFRKNTRKSSDTFGLSRHDASWSTPLWMQGVVELRQDVQRKHREGLQYQLIHALHPMFYSLSFLSQWVEALTCLRCTAPDHAKSKCALSIFKPTQEAFSAREHPNFAVNLASLESLLLFLILSGWMLPLSQAVWSGAQVHSLWKGPQYGGLHSFVCSSYLVNN